MPIRRVFESVFGRFLRAVHDKHFNRPFRGFQPQAEFLNGREQRWHGIRGIGDGGSTRSDRDWSGSWTLQTESTTSARQRYTLGTEPQFDIKQALQIRFVDDRASSKLAKHTHKGCDRYPWRLHRHAVWSHHHHHGASRHSTHIWWTPSLSRWRKRSQCRGSGAARLRRSLRERRRSLID